MSTSKHDSMMIRHVPVTVGELAELAHEANALQADIVAEADAHRYTRDSLQSSNDARAVLVNELRKADEELADERRTCTAMEQTALTLRAQLDVERAKHARATQHIARMVTATGWPVNRPNGWAATLNSQQARHEQQVASLRAQVARLTEGLASSQAALGIAPLEFAVGDYVRLVAAHNDGVLDNVYLISEATPGSSLPYYLGDACQWVPASAVEAVEQPSVEPEPESPALKIGDRVEILGSRYGAKVTSGKGVITKAQGNYHVQTDEQHPVQPWWAYMRDELRLIEWQPGERIEVGAEVEYVGTALSHVGARGVVTEIYPSTLPGSTIDYIHGTDPKLQGARVTSVRRVS